MVGMRGDDDSTVRCDLLVARATSEFVSGEGRGPVWQALLSLTQ